MPRVYGNVDEITLHLIDGQASSQGLNRSEWIGKAIESYLHLEDAKDSTQEFQAKAAQQVQEIAHLNELLKVRESEIQHLRSMTNDLRSLADSMAAKIPALPPGKEEIKKKGWWHFW